MFYQRAAKIEINRVARCTKAKIILLNSLNIYLYGIPLTVFRIIALPGRFYFPFLKLTCRLYIAPILMGKC